MPLKRFIFDFSTGSESLFVQLLRMTNYFRNSKKKRILCINEEIEPAFDGSNSNHFVLLDYPNPINQTTIDRVGGMIPTFITATSKYINDTGDSEVLRQLGATKISDKDLPSNFQYCIDEYHFSGLLNALDSLLFKLDLGIHNKDDYKQTRKEVLIDLNRDCSNLSVYKKRQYEQAYEDAKEQFQKMQDAQKKLLELINNGFLSVQNNTMAELKYLI